MASPAKIAAPPLKGALRKLALWSIAVRPYAYPASIVPVALGAACAWRERGIFLQGRFLLALLAGMLYHTGANLLNDFCDYRRGVDREGVRGGSGVLVKGLMSPQEIAAGAASCLAAGTLIGFHFIARCGWPILLIGAAGLAGAILYTATPWSAKYHAWGEPLVFFMMGVGMVLGSYTVQTNYPSWGALWVSIPVSFSVAAILQANDACDIESDRSSGITTLSMLLGPAGARGLYGFLLLAPFASLAALAAAGAVPAAALIAFAAFPAAWRLNRAFRAGDGADAASLAAAVPGTARFHLLFGLLMTAGILLGGTPA